MRLVNIGTVTPFLFFKKILSYFFSHPKLLTGLQLCLQAVHHDQVDLFASEVVTVAKTLEYILFTL